MEQYVIYLNEHGYWIGKDYIFQGEKFPVTQPGKGFGLKMYHNKKVAENALKRCIGRYANVVSGRVEETSMEVKLGEL